MALYEKNMDLDLGSDGVLHFRFNTLDGEILDSSNDRGHELTDHQYKIVQEWVADWIADRNERESEAARDAEPNVVTMEQHLESGNPSLFRKGES